MNELLVSIRTSAGCLNARFWQKIFFVCICVFFISIIFNCSGDEDSSPETDATHQPGSDATIDDGNNLSNCEKGVYQSPGALCIGQGDEFGADVTLIADQAVTFSVSPKGCFSSTCTTVYQATCTVEVIGNQLQLKSHFCLEMKTEGACTADRGGGGTTQCSSPKLKAGSYTAKLGDLALTFTIPGKLAANQSCSNAL